MPYQYQKDNKGRLFQLVNPFNQTAPSRYDSSNNITCTPGAANNTIVYTPGVSQNVNGTDSFFGIDWLGSTRYLTDSTGNTATASPRYTAFGERTNAREAVWPSDFQFAGGFGYQTEWAATYEPGTGLQYLRHRYYDPGIGRFISPDPVGFLAGLDLYRYIGNDAVNSVDPLGFQEAPRDPTELSSPGATVRHLVDTRQWQVLREYLSDIIGTVREESSFQRILRPLRGEVEREFTPVLRRYPATRLECIRAAAELQDVLVEREVQYDILELRATGPRAIQPTSWLDKLRWWRGGPTYSTSGYHKAISVYGRVYDTVTGPKGLPYNEWLERLGISESDIWRRTPIRPGTLW